MSSSLLELKNVSKVYNVGDSQVFALTSIDLKIEHGEFIVIMGSSGSGKSTLLQILGSLDSVSEGDYFVEGRNFTNKPESELVKLRNQHFGFVFQAYYLLPELTALENVALPLTYANCPWRDCVKRAAEALDRVGLNHRREHYPRQLSGGEQQRVAIARAVVNNPAVLFGDEPTGNLAVDGRNAILSYFEEFHQEGSTIVLVSHDLEVGARASRRVYLKNGRLDESQAALEQLLSS